MSDEGTPAGDGPGGLVEALNVPRNVGVGLAVGAGVAVVGYLVRVLELLGPVPGGRSFPVLGPEVYFLLLAGVLASTAGALVAAALTLVSAYRVARRHG